MHIDHAGIATEDAAEIAEQYVELFGCELAHEEEFDGIKIIFLEFENGCFELLDPMEPTGPIASYLESNGPGIHHLAVATDDIEAALTTARELGIELVDETPRPGAWGHDVAFLHPNSTGGILLEFVQH